MFDAGYTASDCVHPEPEGEKSNSSKRQYTLKGVEEETIRLMREAAGQEGMKIGSWVSLRLREAAMKALDLGSLSADRSLSNSPQKKCYDHASDESIIDLINLLREQREDFESRFIRIEREVQEMASGQRAIMANLLLSQRGF